MSQGTVKAKPGFIELFWNVKSSLQSRCFLFSMRFVQKWFLENVKHSLILNLKQDLELFSVASIVNLYPCVIYRKQGKGMNCNKSARVQNNNKCTAYSAHYGRFWKMCLQNFGMNFACSKPTLFKFLTFYLSKYQKTTNLSSDLRIYQIELKLQLPELKFKLEFCYNNHQNRL